MDSSFGGYLLITFGKCLELDAKKNENRFIDLLVDEWKIAVDGLRDGEVEEDIDAAEGEVVEEAEEVDADGARGGDCVDVTGEVWGKYQSFIDGF